MIHHYSKPSSPSSLSSLTISDDVRMSGIIVPRWDVVKPGERCTVDLILLVNHAQVVAKKRQEEEDVPPELAAMFQVLFGRLD